MLEERDLGAIDEITDGSDTVAGLVDVLPAQERFAVFERVVKGRAYRELAGELRCSEMVVRKRVSRGLMRIRKGLAQK